MTTKCTDVLRATIFLPSYHPLRYKLIINIPIIGMAILISMYIIPKNTLATTIVEECSRLDTGVGPSIAMGNQYPNNQIADFLSKAIITGNHT